MNISTYLYSFTRHRDGLHRKRSAVLFAAFMALLLSFQQAVHALTRITSDITSDTTWKLADSPYLIVKDPLYVNRGATLTIQPGTVVKFQYDNSNGFKRRITVLGVLKARGTAAHPIVFTSDRDDFHGGDSNGDGPSHPFNGPWGYVAISGRGSVIEHCQFWYGGRYHQRPYSLYVYGVPLDIRRCLFKHSIGGIYFREGTFDSSSSVSSCKFENYYQYGIAFSGNPGAKSRFTVSGNTFENGETGVVIRRDGTRLSISRNHFNNLSDYGVKNEDSSITVSARDNWWGKASGPGGSGRGSGSPVSAHVDYANWWTEEDADDNGVWNVFAQRRGDTLIVDIYYDLIGLSGTTYEVGIEVSETGGGPYAAPIRGSLRGAAGRGMAPGLGLHAVWDAGYGGGGNYTDTMRLKVTADIE